MATTITFRNDEDRENFQIMVALNALRSEVKRNTLVCSPRKASTLSCLRRYWPQLKKTRKSAYKQLVEAGIYKILDEHLNRKHERSPIDG